MANSIAKSLYGPPANPRPGRWRTAGDPAGSAGRPQHERHNCGASSWSWTVVHHEETQPGVDLILPDFSWIEERMDDVVSLVSPATRTIGAVPYLKLRGDIRSTDPT